MRPRVSIVTRPGTSYPVGGEAFSPLERYPEYPFSHTSSRPNHIYPMVRQLLAQLGLDADRFGSPSWNPLGRYIPPGSRVFMLCNFVFHRRPGESVRDFLGKCTHAAVLRALADYVLIAVGPRGRLVLGNAPLQSCNWSRVIAETGLAEVLRFYEQAGAGVEARDLRLFISEITMAGRIRTVERTLDDGNIVEIDLGNESLLAGLSRSGNARQRFRIGDYNPERIESFHQGEAHRYHVHRAITDSDVILSVPKLKTHEKVGVTCGLKGFVGTVAHKDCLAHHRFGSPASGGDEYPPGARLLTPVSHFSDWVNRRPEHDRLKPGLQVAERNVKRFLRRVGLPMAGAWHGNDTAWRMALDLARIVYYADGEGVMHDTPQRTHLSVIDGIVGGEGNGPLAPRAVDSGTLIFSDDVPLGDRVACQLMGFDAARVPLVTEAMQPARRALSDATANVMVFHNGEQRPVDDIEPVLGRPFAPPRGWRGHIEAPSTDTLTTSTR